MAGLAILKHTHDLSDEALRDRRLKNRCFQLFRKKELLTMLYRSTHRLCRAGAPVKYLTHNPSRSTVSESVPSYSGTKHLG
jgi:hypothetical protein